MDGRAAEICIPPPYGRIQYLYSMFRSSVIVLWSWQLLHRGYQFVSSQNKSGSPRCGLI